MTDNNAPVSTTKRAAKPGERNSLLKKYYGIKSTSSPSTVLPEENARPFDLDGNTFNSSKYFGSLLKEKTLQGLIEKDNQLIGEIREIDGDMKTLVYENYSKFISATDTIRKMKSNVESMESEMSRLNENIANISRQSKIINKELGPNRQKIQQLSNVHNSLKRLQFIFELPNRLQHCLVKGKYGQAVKYFSKASKLLNHYQHMAAFKGIERDCNAIMEKVKAEIWTSMTDPSVTLQNIAEETKLLVLLGEDAHTLWKHYIDVQMDVLQKKQAENKSPVSIQDLVVTFVMPLEDIVRHFESLFLRDANSSNGDDENADGITIENLSNHDKDQAKADLLEAINPHLDQFFDLAFEFIELPLNISLATPLQQAEHLAELKSSILSQTPSLSLVAKIDDRLQSLSSNWENDLIKGSLDSALAGLRKRIDAFITSLQKTSESQDFDTDGIAGFIQDTQTWLIHHLITSCLIPLKDCLDISNQETLARIQYSIKGVWQKLALRFKNLHKTSKLDQRSLQIIILVGSRLCYDLADNGIFQTYSAFSSKFCKKQEDQERTSYRSPDMDASIDPRVIPDMNEMIEIYLETGQALFNKQMMQEGYRISSRIQEAYLYYRSTSGSVEQVSEIWHFCFNRLKYTERLVEALYLQEQPPRSPRGSIETNTAESEYDYGGPYSRHMVPSTHSLATASSISETPTNTTKLGGNDITLNMMNNIDKLFAERVDIYRNVDPSPAGVCTGLILIMLKAFLEVAREIQMSTLHCQQLQVDVEFVKRIIWPFVGDEKWATTMLQEVLSSIYTRCSSPVSIGPDELALILSPQ
ncbi:exocyst complex component Sec5-domain-containing protein [Parasitella parasitica]|nr:exocyst complex component Sec5-domain-containing protein [Parasitella parasitica]